MKNFPHQFNDVEKLRIALEVAEQLTEKNTPITDEKYGEELTRKRIYTYRDKNLSIEEYLAGERQKPKDSRGHLTVARDIRRFLELLGFIVVLDNLKNVRITPNGKQLLIATSVEQKRILWKEALLQMGLEGTDGEISHPYRILLKIVNTYPGIETKKLLLALEAENDSVEEFDRICALAALSVEEIIQETGTTGAMAANAVKILPGIAEQLKDIERISNSAYPVGHIVVTEDEISTEEEPEIGDRTRRAFRNVSAAEIAIDPKINAVSSASIDISDAIRARQKRLAEHQEIVRLLAERNERNGIQLFEGKFDCLGRKGDSSLLYEVKTILESTIDQERQTVKGVGQLKYYKYSIIQKQMGLSNIREVLVFSRKPNSDMIDFCTAEKIAVIWRDDDSFCIYNAGDGREYSFDPQELL